MGNVVTNVCAKTYHDRLRMDKALENFWKSDNNEKNKNKKKNNVRSAWGPFPGRK